MRKGIALTTIVECVDEEELDFLAGKIQKLVDNFLDKRSEVAPMKTSSFTTPLTWSYDNPRHDGVMVNREVIS